MTELTVSLRAIRVLGRRIASNHWFRSKSAAAATATANTVWGLRGGRTPNTI